MLEPHQIEELICLASAMDRDQLTDRLINFQGNFPVDFSPEFLSALPVERLAHIFVALCLQNRRAPSILELNHAA